MFLYEQILFHSSSHLGTLALLGGKILLIFPGFFISWISQEITMKFSWNLLQLNNTLQRINCRKIWFLTLSPPLNQAKTVGFGGLQFLEKGDEGISASTRINYFVQNFTENPMVKSAMF